MLGKMNIINPENFIKAFDDMQCGRTNVAQISSQDFELKQFTTQPLHGYEAPKNFPNCCGKHKQLVQNAAARFDSFPDCCENHRRLNSAPWFKKQNYAYLPQKLVTTVAYTWHCIAKNIESDDWYKKITDYIEYTRKSYGQFPDGFGAPFGLALYIGTLEADIENEKEIPTEKKEKMLAYLRKQDEPPEQIEQTDINLLISKYKEWLKIFPFELSFLSHLKPYFERQIPILSGKGETNIYTGLTGFKLKSKRELLSFLLSVTLTIIKEVNTRQLFNNDLLTNTDELHLEILVAKRKVEIEELDKSGWEDRKDYIKLLKKWLKGEKKFVKEINEIFKGQCKTDFTRDLLNGIWALQKNDTNEPCIMNIRENKPDKETAFRYWFKNYFTARYPDAIVTAEEEKGNGRIDLKVSHKLFGDKIIEFKGWWNQDKKSSPEQICSYLTDFEKEGYIFMINHLEKKTIDIDYKSFITNSAMSYVPDSWKDHRYESTDMVYYESRHLFSAKEKVVYHFIFNVNFSNQKK